MIHPCDSQTDGQTDGRTGDIIYVYIYAVARKKVKKAHHYNFLAIPLEIPTEKFNIQ